MMMWQTRFRADPLCQDAEDLTQDFFLVIPEGSWLQNAGSNDHVGR